MTELDLYMPSADEVEASLIQFESRPLPGLMEEALELRRSTNRRIIAKANVWINVAKPA